MEANDPEGKKVSKRFAYVGYLKISAVYLAIALVMFWPVSTNPLGTLTGWGGDIFQSVWNLWWVSFSVFTLHASPYFTNFVYFPVGAQLLISNLAPLAGILSAPLQAVGSAFTFNVVFFVGITLSGLGMYLLAHHLTKNGYASFIAGLIYAFSPIHIIQAFSHVEWINIEFLPLFILFFLLMIKEKNYKFTILSAASFLLLTFFSDPEQAIIGLLIAVFILLYYLLRDRKEILNMRFITHFAVMSIIIIILALPVLLIALNALNSGILSLVNNNTSPQTSEQWSVDLLGFFVPGPMNGIFYGVSNSYAYLYSPDPLEKTGYIGYTVIALALIAIYADYKKTRLKTIGLFVFLSAMFMWLSLGPYIQVNGSSTGVPGIYLLLSKVPLLNTLREPGRFGMASELGLAVLAAFGFDALSKSGKRFLPKKTAYLAAIVVVLLLIEYNSIPLSSAQVGSEYTNVQIPTFFYNLSQSSSNFTMLYLPALANYTNVVPALYPGEAMYLQTAAHKPLVGGYNSRTNASEELDLESIPIVLEATYLQAGYGFTYQYPIQENYTLLTLLYLNSYNVGFVTVFNNAYSASERQTIIPYMESVFGPPVYQNANYTVFQTSNAIPQDLERNVVSFTPSTQWIFGSELCAANVSCNSTIQSMWWGANERDIVVYSPTNQTSLQVSFNTLSYFGDEKLYVYLDGSDDLLATINTTSALAHYSLSVPINSQTNELIFYTSNSTFTNSAQGAINFGISNLTIS